MKDYLSRACCVIFMILVTIAVGYVAYHTGLARKSLEPKTPSQILRFKPVQKGSDPHLVSIAQAELSRHGIDIGKVDGDCGKATALGMCEYLVMLENGYKPHTIFERNHNVEE